MRHDFFSIRSFETVSSSASKECSSGKGHSVPWGRLMELSPALINQPSLTGLEFQVIHFPGNKLPGLLSSHPCGISEP